jgi:1-phosphofructokinase family hexose kinase
MILTVCPNTALDRILFIGEWISGTPMRTDRIVNSVGGKGLNSAVVLRHLGVETVGIGFFAGKIGQELVDIVEEYGIITEAIWAGGTNRVAHVIAELKNKRHSHVIAGQTLVSEEQKYEFIDRFKVRVREADWVIFAGSIPKSLNDDFYAELIPIAQAENVPTLIDSQKAFMIEALKTKPDIVKLNWQEFEWTFNKKAETLDSLLDQAKELFEERKLKNLVLTLGKDGILAFTKEGIYLSKAPLQEPKNAAGAGDAVSSALVWRFTKGDDWQSAMKWASAVSAASVLTERTGDVFKEDIDRIFPMATI